MNPADLSAVAWFWIALGGLLLSALFAALRLALLDLSRVTYSELLTRAARRRTADAGSEAPENGEDATPVTSASRVLDDTDGHAMALAVPLLMARFVSVLSLVSWLAVSNAPAGGAEGGEVMIRFWDLTLGLLIAAGASWLLGIVAPHAVATHAGERLVFTLAPLVRACALLAYPLRLVVVVVDETVRRLAGAERRDEAAEIQAELLEVVEEGERGGNLDEIERDMIEAVVEFRTTSVERIMTPRTEITALAYTDDLPEVMQGVRSIGHSRIPVYENDLDHIVGLLYARDLLAFLADRETDEDDAPDGPFELRALLRPAVFVPETKSVRELLRELLAQRVHIAMVADEYGGTSGLITIEDIVEEVFGDIEDEYEEPADEDAGVRLRPDGRSADVEARVYIDDANDRLEDVGIELPEHEDYDTVGGFVVVGLGRIPETGESYRENGLRVTVLDAEPTRVVRVRVELVDEEE